MEEKEKEFAQIVKEHKRQIYTVCYMFSKDADEVADLFQEILINMWKGFSSFRSESSISTWIWRISLNTCINTGKRRKLETIPLDVKSILMRMLMRRACRCVNFMIESTGSA